MHHKSRVLLTLILALAGFASAQTTSSNFYPTATGLNLGNPNQQWNLYSQDGNIYRNFRLWNSAQSHNYNVLPNFTNSLIYCVKDDGTRCYFDGGSAITNGLNYRGLWDPGTPYVLQDVVSYQGSSYVAIATSTGVAPGTDTSKWQVFAQAGQNGVNGTNGTSGTQGAPGTPGYSPNQLLSGGGVGYTQSGYTFVVSAASYLINNTNYASPPEHHYSGRSRSQQ